MKNNAVRIAANYPVHDPRIFEGSWMIFFSLSDLGQTGPGLFITLQAASNHLHHLSSKRMYS
jgi:hypothetical protein